MFSANSRNVAASKLRTKMIALEPSLLLELDRALSNVNFSQQTGLSITRCYALKANTNEGVKRILRGGMLDFMKEDAKIIHNMEIFKQK